MTPTKGPAPARAARRALPRNTALAAALAAALTSAGCVTRTIRVTSEPPGARVWLNDIEIGTTPAEAGFDFYGEYDVRLELDGYRTVSEGRTAKAPLHEIPGIDLAAHLLPVEFDHTVEWHFDMEPQPETLLPPEQLEAELLERALQLRERARSGG